MTAFRKVVYSAIFVFSGALIALSISMIFPKKWEAVATMRVGSVAGIPIESSAELVDRLRSPETISEVLQILETKQGIDDEALLSATRISTIGGSIQVRVRASSPDFAIEIINGYLKVVKAQQNNLLEQQVVFAKNYGFLEKTTVVGFEENNYGDNHRVKNLERLIMTFPTRFSVTPAALSKPVSPNTLLMLLFGAFLGGGIAWLRLRDW